MRNRILWKLMASFAAVLLLFALISGTVYLTLFRQHTVSITRTELEKKAATIASTLSSFSSRDTKGHGGTEGYGAYMRYLGDLTMASVWILDTEMNLQAITHQSGSDAHSSHLAVGRSSVNTKKLPDNAQKIVKKVLSGKATYGEEFSSVLDTPSITAGAPIRSPDGQITGAVLLHSPVSGIDSAVRRGLSTLFSGAVIALLFAVAAALFLAFRFTTPLQRMKTTARKLSGGDYDARTKVKRKDEIGQLAEDIDDLAVQLAKAKQERAELDKLKEDFIANVSHELRTPIAVLRGSIEVLKDKTVSSPEAIAEYYRQMLAESRHLERLVNDLLDLSRLQDEAFTLIVEEVNLCDLVRDASRAVRRQVENKQIRFSQNLPDKSAETTGDYGRIRQMLLILLDNAIKFSPEGGAVDISLTTEQKTSLLTVTNTGPTIPPDQLPRIFDRFHKSTGPQNASGTGLGLAIAKQIANRHEAIISVSSAGEQTAFQIKFPAR